MSRRVVVVDDEPFFLKSTARMLEHAGFNALTACDGIQGLELIRASAGSINLVVSDIRMPRMSGLDMAAEISRLRPGLPILFMSVSGGMETPKATKRVNPCRFLEKPFRLKQLLREVELLLAGNLRRREIIEAWDPGCERAV